LKMHIQFFMTLATNNIINMINIISR